MTTSVARASPSTSSATMNSGLPAWMTFSSSGSRSLTFEILRLDEQDVRVLEDGLLALRVGHEVRRQEALVEAHALGELELEAQRAGLLDGDDAFLADLVERLGDQVADRLVAGGDGGRGGDLLLGLDVLRLREQGSGDGLDGLLDALLQRDRVGAGRDVAQALAHERLGEHGGGGGAVARDVVRLLGDLLDELRTDLLEGVLEVDLLGDGDAVVGDRGGAPLLVQDDVAALRAEGDLDGVGEDVESPLDAAAGLLVEGNDLGHGAVILHWVRVGRGCPRRTSTSPAVLSRVRRPSPDGRGDSVTLHRRVLSPMVSTRPPRVQAAFAQSAVADAGPRGRPSGRRVSGPRAAATPLSCACARSRRGRREPRPPRRGRRRARAPARPAHRRRRARRARRHRARRRRDRPARRHRAHGGPGHRRAAAPVVVAEPAAPGYATIPLYLEGLTTMPRRPAGPARGRHRRHVPGRHPRRRPRGLDPRARGRRRDAGEHGATVSAAAPSRAGSAPGSPRAPSRAPADRTRTWRAPPCSTCTRSSSPTAPRWPPGRRSGGTCGRATRRSSPSPWPAPGTSTTPSRSSASSTASSRPTARSRRGTCPTAPDRRTTAACRPTAPAGRCGPPGSCSRRSPTPTSARRPRSSCCPWCSGPPGTRSRWSRSTVCRRRRRTTGRCPRTR